MSRAGEWESQSDEALVLSYQRDPLGTAGREAASCLISRWRGRVYQWAYRVVREREQALDVAQDSLVQMYEALPRYESRGKFSGWLFTIVHNRSLASVRRRPLARDPEVDTDDLTATGLGPEAWFEEAENQRRTLQAMKDALNDEERTALWLRAFEGMTVEQITRVLRLEGASGARGVLQTARRKLRAALATGATARKEAP